MKTTEQLIRKLKSELSELEIKEVKLFNYLASLDPDKPECGNKQLELIKSQYVAMEYYANALRNRLTDLQQSMDK